MIKILTNNKSAGFMIMPLVLLSLGILSAGSYSWASDAELSESSTAQTYYDSLIGYQQKQESDLIKFKEGIGTNVSGLKEGISGLNSKIKSGQLKYNYNKGSVALGSLYGSKGQLGLDKSAYKGLSSAVSDTERIDTLSSNRQVPIAEPRIVQATPMPTPQPQPVVTPPINPVCMQVCTPTCTQSCVPSGYGQVCTQTCTQTCTQVCK